jgi:4-diphosphocytidyl-2-C-methyl-D-erythritol kinase
MISFPNAKINLGLNVTGIRADGFHEIETVMVPVGFCDILEIVPAVGQRVDFHQTGLAIPGSGKDNLCLRACQLVESQIDSGVKMHLHKVIPMGSGLGGGSSDAVSTLKLLKTLFIPGMNDQQMMDLAGKLGSDCTFFIRNQTVFATGKGDQLNAIELNLEGLSVFIVIPPVHVSTAEAYKNVKVRKPAVSIPSILKASPAQWKHHLLNDFEESVFERYPEIREIKEKLYASGALYASMSGSGSAVYGLFDRPLPPASFKDYTTWSGKLS